MFDLKPQLLVIDDDVQIRRVYGRLLVQDFVVETEAEAWNALRRIAAGAHFDVILCDVNLGCGMSGPEFFEAAPRYLQRRIVMCSASPPEANDAFAAELGPRYVAKLGNIDGLISLLNSVAGVPPRFARSA
jgi:CheY-like chemotaxis protein